MHKAMPGVPVYEYEPIQEDGVSQKSWLRVSRTVQLWQGPFAESTGLATDWHIEVPGMVLYYTG
eukprot:6054004-Amphidinium_carterae.2